MTDIDRETYLVNKRTGRVHIAVGGRTLERCNVDDAKHLVEVATIEEVGSVTKRRIRFCRWCRPTEEL